MLIFAKAAFSSGLTFGLAADGVYAEMIPYRVPSLVLFGACAPVPAHLADKWSRNGRVFSTLMLSFDEIAVKKWSKNG